MNGKRLHSNRSAGARQQQQSTQEVWPTTRGMSVLEILVSAVLAWLFGSIISSVICSVVGVVWFGLLFVFS
jgi:hypothetical protein